MSKRIDDLRDETGTPRHRVGVSWLALLLLGVVIYECTEQPGLAAAVTCAKLGWGDWSVAFWLRRVDPDWRRGRTCFWFYLAFGLWKVAVLATGMMLILLALGSAGNPQQPAVQRLGGLPPAVVGALIAAGVGFGLSFLLTYLALWCAMRHGIKVWLGVAPRLARTERYWPPSQGEQNAAQYVAVTTVILTLWCAVLGTALAGMALGPGPSAISLLIVLALASPATLLVLKYLERHVVARTPAECWPLAEEELVYQPVE